MQRNLRKELNSKWTQYSPHKWTYFIPSWLSVINKTYLTAITWRLITLEGHEQENPIRNKLLISHTKSYLSKSTSLEGMKHNPVTLSSKSRPVTTCKITQYRFIDKGTLCYWRFLNLEFLSPHVTSSSKHKMNLVLSHTLDLPWVFDSSHYKTLQVGRRSQAGGRLIVYQQLI